MAAATGTTREVSSAWGWCSATTSTARRRFGWCGCSAHLARFGLENHNEVFHADDRPYGLIETTVLREGAISELDPG
jgi:hypothetical protein